MLNKAELKLKLAAWEVEATEKVNCYLQVRRDLVHRIHNHNLTIMKSFITFHLRALSPSDFEYCKKDIYEAFERYDLVKIMSLPSYSMTTPLAVLRIHYRKIQRINNELHAERQIVKDLLSRLKEIDKSIQEVSKKDSSDALLDMEFNIMSHRETIMEILNGDVDPEIDFLPYIEGLFVGNRKLKRDDFLQVITLTKRLRYWDGNPVLPFSRRSSEIPEDIDFEEFQRLIFIEKIEDFYDDYLSDIFIDHMFKVMDEHKKETGKPLFDPFEVLEQITGKPLQTFTAQTDEYGDIVNIEPNKPRLRKIDGGKH